MGRKIQTVTGPILPEQLGVIRMHEHMFIAYPGCDGDFSSGKHYTKAQTIKSCVTHASHMAHQGFATLVDATPNDCGRNPLWLKEISEKSGLNIICSTGFYREGSSGNAYWHLRNEISNVVEELEELMLIELKKGIGDTDICAGVIKLATGPVFTNYAEWFFAAAARAQRQTGAVIITHTENGRPGLEQARSLLKNGADPGKVAIGHMCGCIEPNYHEKILRMGFCLNFDRIGLYKEDYPADEERLDLLLELLHRGWEDRICLSQDVIGKFLGRPFEWTPQEKIIYRNYRYSYLMDGFVPMMKTRGVTQTQIDKFLIINPKRMFS